MTELSTDRRNLMRTAAIGGIGLTAGAVFGGGAVAVAAANERSAAARSLVVEVACLGHTTRNMPPPLLWSLFPQLGQELDEEDLRGASWYVEGMMYPEGTIRGNGFLPTEVDQIGVWFCRGHSLGHSERPDPHLVTQQEYYFGSLADDPIGSRMLLSAGVEGRDRDGWRGHRAVIGGTGIYRGARGEVVQEETGTNSTDFPWGGKAPNFRFEFDFDVL